MFLTLKLFQNLLKFGRSNLLPTYVLVDLVDCGVDFYRPQTKFAKVMFLQVSVCPHGGACMVLFGRGVCLVLFGGVCGFIRGGHAWFYSGGHVRFYLGGVHGFFSFFGNNEIRSMSGWYASYWNAFLCDCSVAALKTDLN